MAFSTTDAISDFENNQLDEFGESVVYHQNGSSKTINACIYRTQNANIPLPGASSNIGHVKMRIKISQGSTNGMENIIADEDYVTVKLLPGDATTRDLTVKSVNDEYGCWDLGLL